MSSSSSSIMETLFQRTLDDLIKALKYAHQTPAGEPPGVLVSKAVEEIRREVKSTDPFTKSIALQKLCYASSLHFQDMSWASFHAVECISSQNYSHKRTGYLSISQSFSDSTPVILLITNQLRKDLKSKNEFEVSLALDCLSRIGTLDLCRDLTPEVFALMSSSKLLVKKKALGVVLRVFERYPEAVKVCFMRLVEGLESNEHGILSAVVGVFCELACKEPKSYLPLAPEFYKVLVDSKNNWVLIKVLKIFTKLAPLEPRLAKRIVDPVCEIMRKSDAKSVVFECIKTVVTSLLDHDSAVKLAGEKIREFLMEDDPNLRYLGLHALTILSQKHLSAVSENKEIVIKSLSDADPNIKLESLHLLMTLVSENNVAELCHALVNIALKSSPEFCNEILGSILSTCSYNVYALITDFDWYVSLLGDISRNVYCQRGDEIGFQLIDISMRVRDVRPKLVRVSRDLLIDPSLLGNPFLFNVLSAAAWICGEYVEFCMNIREIMDAFLQPRTNLLPSSARSVYVQSLFKVIVFCLISYLSNELDEEDSATEFSLRSGNLTFEYISDTLNKVQTIFGSLYDRIDLEEQERVRNVLAFVEFINPFFTDIESLDRTKLESLFKVVEFVQNCFSTELGPVSAVAQERVHLPDGLVLLDNLSELDPICGDQKLDPKISIVEETGDISLLDSEGNENSGTCSESTSLLAEHRKRHELFYLLSERNDSDYPPANDPKMNDDKMDDDHDDDDDTSYLVKITENSLKLKNKRGNSKARPVVVKLEETDVAPLAEKGLRMKEDAVSSVVRDLLSASDKRCIEKNEKIVEDSVEKVDGYGGGSSSKRESKGRKKGSHHQNKNDGDKEKRKRRNGHRRNRDVPHDGTSSIAVQSVPLPDLLL